jgi:DNA-binding beta-propeller fold protein YncE
MNGFHLTGLLGAAWLLITANPGWPQEAGSTPSDSRSKALPGLQSNGVTLLPNQWSLRPAGKQLELGDFPVNLALHPSGRWLAALHAGYGVHEVAVVDLKRQRIANRVSLDQAFCGLCFSPDGRSLFASGGEDEVVHTFAFDEKGLLSQHREFRLAEKKEKFLPSGLAVNSEGSMIVVAGLLGDEIRLIPLEAPTNQTKIPLEKGSFPYNCALSLDGKRVFASQWGKASIAVIDVAQKQLVATWATERNPTEMVLTPDGKTLFVACANSTQVSVLDTGSGKCIETLACALYPPAPSGNTPNSLCLTPDGSLLFVANADANNLAVFNVSKIGQAKPLGFVPVGWYPTSVRFNAADKRLYVANGKGLSSKANPQGPQPTAAERHTIREYIGGLFRGTLGILELPTPAQMGEYSKQAYACSPLREDQSVPVKVPEDSPVPGKVGAPSPIKHVIYIIKENRTYDQVLGDMKQGNGDPNLCLFPERVTPNHHKLAAEFVLLDNFYVDGEVSADGHQWSMAAYATDFVEKTWPLVYRGGPRQKLTYPSEGNYEALARPAGGYLWDRCAEAGVSYRSYGEWVANGKTPQDPAKASAKALEGHFDPWFRSFDLDYSDQKRADRFIEELKRFEKEGDLPRLIILRLPNDHTSGTKVGKLTPTAQVADNDLALGRVVEAVSQSRFWKETAFFVLEDDAQNGPDHVDAHRSIAFVASPYCKRGYIDSNMYSTSSMLRTMELILGLKPMSQFDAAARPMHAAFQATPDLRPYQHLVPKANLAEKNGPEAWGAKLSEKFDLAEADMADDLLFNEVIWHSVRGAKSPMPAPVRAAFVLRR